MQERQSKAPSSYPEFGRRRPNYVYSKRELEPTVPKLSVRGRLIVSNALLSEVVWFGWVGVFVGRDLSSAYMVDPRLVGIGKLERFSHHRRVDTRMIFVDKARGKPFGEVNIRGVHGSRHLDIGRYRGVERLHLSGKFVGFRFYMTSDADISTRSKKPDNGESLHDVSTVEMPIDPNPTHWASGDGISVTAMKRKMYYKTVNKYGLTNKENEIRQRNIDNDREIKRLEREIEYLDSE